jgi:enoyl-CoA hydratase
MADYSMILTEERDRVGLVRLNRPKAMNALNGTLMTELMQALEAYDADDHIRAMVVTGNERAFAAGADIKEMADASAVHMLLHDQIGQFDRIRRIHKPLIAAVSGWCLGGGNELAMSCDMIVAAENARFGQPEIGIGVMPGAGGTQRLTRAVGKAIAMEMVLNNRTLTAEEAAHQAFETSLTDGLADERRSFYLLFASQDQKEGMAAFIEKRKPQWRGV